MNWYLETKLRYGNVNWENLVEGFRITFNFEDDFPCIESTLHTIRDTIFGNATSLTWQQPDWITQLEHALECYNIIIEEDEDLRNIDIAE